MERTKVNRRKRRTVKRIVIAGTIVGMFFVGRFTAPTKIETVTKTKTVEAPRYSAQGLPSNTDITYLDIPLSHNLQEYITEVCSDENVPVSLIYAMIEHESHFNSETISGTDDYGLMQINCVNEDTLKAEYRSADLLNPYQNVFCGVKIISSYLKKYDGDYRKALMAYNMGEYGAQKAWQDGITTSPYSDEILSIMNEYEQELSDGNDNGDQS